MRRGIDQRDQAWATLVSFLGLPAEPAWDEYVLGVIEREERIKSLDGIGCQRVLISAKTEEVIDWMGDGLHSHALNFPERNGPVRWPLQSWADVLHPAPAIEDAIPR